MFFLFEFCNFCQRIMHLATHLSGDNPLTKTYPPCRSINASHLNLRRRSSKSPGCIESNILLWKEDDGAHDKWHFGEWLGARSKDGVVDDSVAVRRRWQVHSDVVSGRHGHRYSPAIHRRGGQVIYLDCVFFCKWLKLVTRLVRACYALVTRLGRASFYQL